MLQVGEVGRRGREEDGRRAKGESGIEKWVGEVQKGVEELKTTF